MFRVKPKLFDSGLACVNSLDIWAVTPQHTYTYKQAEEKA